MRGVPRDGCTKIGEPGWPACRIAGRRRGPPWTHAGSGAKPAVVWPACPSRDTGSDPEAAAQAERRERIVVIMTVVVTALAVVVLIAATAGKSRPEPGPGCIRATIAHVMGGEELNACGARARDLRAKRGSSRTRTRWRSRRACRKAGYL